MKDGVTTLDEVKRAADEYNKIAAVAAKNGLKQALHNEGFENSRLPDGRRTYFALMEHFDPKLVFMQFQMSSMRGMDINPIQLFHTYPGRIISLHVQGVNMNPPRGVHATALRQRPARGRRQLRQPVARRAAVAAAVAAVRGWRRRPRVGTHLRSRQDRRSPELLRRAELAADGAERGVPQEPERLGRSDRRSDIDSHEGGPRRSALVV